jgi:hypothetical protein
MVLHITTPQPNLQPSNVTKKILSDTVSSCHVPSDQGATITAGDVRVNGIANVKVFTFPCAR